MAIKQFDHLVRGLTGSYKAEISKPRLDAAAELFGNGKHLRYSKPVSHSSMEPKFKVEQSIASNLIFAWFFHKTLSFTVQILERTISCARGTLFVTYEQYSITWKVTKVTDDYVCIRMIAYNKNNEKIASCSCRICK